MLCFGNLFWKCCGTGPKVNCFFAVFFFGCCWDMFLLNWNNESKPPHTHTHIRRSLHPTHTRCTKTKGSINGRLTAPSYIGSTHWPVATKQQTQDTHEFYMHMRLVCIQTFWYYFLLSLLPMLGWRPVSRKFFRWIWRSTGCWILWEVAQWHGRSSTPSPEPFLMRSRHSSVWHHMTSGESCHWLWWV